MMTSTPYLARISIKECVGCGICVNMCNLGAIPQSFIGYISTVADIDENKCDGCGKCIPLCPQKAIKLIKVLSNLD